MAILELFATSGFDEAANLEAANDALKAIGERLALCVFLMASVSRFSADSILAHRAYAGQQIEDPACVH